MRADMGWGERCPLLAQHVSAALFLFLSFCSLLPSLSLSLSWSLASLALCSVEGELE